MDKTGQTLIISGATGGISRALLPLLKEAGANLHLVARREAELKDLADTYDASFTVIEDHRLAGFQQAVEDATEKWGGITGGVNCIGSLLLKPAHNTSEAEWNATLETNLFSSFSLLHATAKPLMKNGGSLVFMSSAAARTGFANHEAIAAAKAGIEGMVRSAAATYGRYQLRVNAVAPGLTRTPLTERITGSDASLKASTAMHVLGRIGEAEDVASAIAFLLDPAQSWVTGQVLGVDGGLGTARGR